MKKITFFISLVFFITACNNSPESAEKKENDVSQKEKAPVSGTTGDNNIITFKVNGELVKSSGWNIAYTNLIKGIQGINVTSNMHEEKRTINININGAIPGTYPFQKGTKAISTAGVAYGSYKPDYMKNMLEFYQFESGSFIITTIDSAAGVLNATFSGRAVNKQGESVEITEGKVIKGKLKPAAKLKI